MRRGGHGRTCEGLRLGVLLRQDGVAQVAQALQAVPHVQVGHEPGEAESSGEPVGGCQPSQRYARRPKAWERD